MESAAVTIFQSSLGVASSSLTSRSGSSAAVNGPISVKFGAKLGPSLKMPEICNFILVEKQLEQLQTDRDAENTKEESSAAGTDLVLYRRIAEVKANERRKALEEILYALVVQKFMDSDVSLIPSVSSSSDPSGRVDMWPSQEGKLERLHSPEAYEMIQNHLALILGNRAGGSSSVAQISKLRVGQVYAASVMYGYFLRRVDQRFQLEKTMKILPGGSDGDEFN
ncbi:hypothetical protein CRG98_026151, partial [Punica granatum]